MAYVIGTTYQHRYGLATAGGIIFLLLSVFSGVSSLCSVRCGDLQFWDGEMHHAIPAADIFPSGSQTAADISVKIREKRLRAGLEIPASKVISNSDAVSIPYAAEIRQQISQRQASASRYFWLFLSFGVISVAIFCDTENFADNHSQIGGEAEPRSSSFRKRIFGPYDGLISSAVTALGNRSVTGCRYCH